MFSPQDSLRIKRPLTEYKKETILKYTKIGTIQRRLSWPLRKDDTQICEAFHIFRPVFRASRREQVVISRLRIGHTRLTHAFILKQELQPQCLTCQKTCSVKHNLIECRAFAVIRKWFFKVTSLTKLFENIKIDDVLSFLWETVLYEKIWWIKID